jgi:hypothetical protein
MPKLPHKNNRSGKAAKRALEGASRSQEGIIRTKVRDRAHIAYSSKSPDDVAHLTPRMRKQMGFEAFPSL